MYAPGILWTAAHHKIPILSIMNNNRAYHQELMHVQTMANRHSRGIEQGHIGSVLTEPNIDYARLAESMGVHAEGPITDRKISHRRLPAPSRWSSAGSRRSSISSHRFAEPGPLLAP